MHPRPPVQRQKAHGYWTDPSAHQPVRWYPLYEKMVELDVPAMVHVISCCNPNFHATGSALYQRRYHDLHAKTAGIEALQGFPGPMIWDPARRRRGASIIRGRYRGIAQDVKLPPLAEHLLGIMTLFFDTCVYHQPGIKLLTKVIPIDNILFASEMVGAVRGMDRKPIAVATTHGVTSIRWRPSVQRIMRRFSRVMPARSSSMLRADLDRRSDRPDPSTVRWFLTFKPTPPICTPDYTMALWPGRDAPLRSAPIALQFTGGDRDGAEEPS